jgi:DNA-binding PadR family transcriptional regulator
MATLNDSRRLSTLDEFLFLIKMGNQSGYQIRKAFKTHFDMNVSFGTIYPTLSELHKEGYLSRKESKTDRRKMYSLTKRGRSKLATDIGMLSRTIAKLSTSL